MANESNYSTLIITSIRDFQEVLPHLSFGEVMYALLREVDEFNGDLNCLKAIREVDDKRIYEAIEKAIKTEQE